ncbi:Gfo/Idh/MocA family protein [Aeoliella sp.]|uniref:Gfo/Idh/MocA family protein n=1 Tax=Aeoliella sp. TaxID=2795800 RepID=UPI003CCB91FA
MSDQTPKQAADSRRDFLKHSAVAGSTLAAMSVPQYVHAAGADETIRVGLVGCGGRGTQAAEQALKAEPNARLVAMGDAFLDRAKYSRDELAAKRSVRDQVNVPDEMVFADFDNFKHVTDAVDVVLLATPPHFRPEHFRYAVEQGKHCFVEKPVAVDAPGVRHVMESCQMAEEKGLSVVSGLCWRYAPPVRAVMQQILEEGLIGDVVAVESHYNSGELWHRGDKSDWSRMEYQMRNWLYYTWLSGDHIAEQAIHSLDKCAWLFGDAAPTQVMSIGGRQQRTAEKYGNVYDHFTVFYDFPSGQKAFFTCRQQDGCSKVVNERVLGTKGQASILDGHFIVDGNGKEIWRYKGPKPNMWQQEHIEMFQALRDGKVINNGHYMCNSTMMSVAGRMAGYTGQTLDWETCLNDTERLGPAEYAWTDVPEPPVAMPGRTKLAGTVAQG